MHETDEIADTLKSFWIFMGFFALILLGVVGYVNLLGAIEKLNEPATQVIEREETVDMPNERRLIIKAELAGKGVVPLDSGEVFISETDMPYFEIFGDGVIQVSYSHDKLGFTYQPKFFRFPDPMRGENGDSLYGSFCVTIPASVDIQRIRNEGDGTKLAKDVSRDMRDLTRLYKQYMWELYPDVNENYEGLWRLVYVSHVFITLYDKNDPTRTVAAASVRITSNDDWVLGIKYYGTPKAALEQLGVADQPESTEGTLLQIVSYWQADE